jgi:hypothetical protein
MSMDIYSPEGTKVTFLDRNGTDFDRVEAEKILKVGQVYTIKSIEVYDWVSYVTLEEVPDKTFNSVMFDNLKLK